MVAKWPAVEFSSRPSGFDPERHFRRALASNMSHAETFTWLRFAFLLRLAGDRVEVEYEERAPTKLQQSFRASVPGPLVFWHLAVRSNLSPLGSLLKGLLEVDNDVANVKCDDAPPCSN